MSVVSQRACGENGVGCSGQWAKHDAEGRPAAKVVCGFGPMPWTPPDLMRIDLASRACLLWPVIARNWQCNAFCGATLGWPGSFFTHPLPRTSMILATPHAATSKRQEV